MVSPTKTNAPKVALSPALGNMLAVFFAWWSGELSAMVPTWLLGRWAESNRAILVGFDSAQVVLERIDGGQRKTLLSVAAGDEGGLEQRALIASELGRKLASITRSNERLLLCLAAERVFRRTVSVPLALEENLRQALSFELDRYTPFKPEQVYFDFRVTERDALQRRLTLDLAVVRRQEVDSTLARALGLGLRVGAVVLAEDAIRHRTPLNFLPASGGTPTRSSRTWWRLGLGLLVIALLATLLAIPVLQKRASAINLLLPLAQAKAGAQEADALRDRLDKLVAESNLLPDKKWNSHSTIVVLDELTFRLKDDTYLNHFDFDGKTVTLQGESDSAAGLVEVLEASPVFKDVAFKSQLTKVQGTAYARFHIAAQLEDEARPKPPQRAVEATPDPAAEPIPNNNKP
jgi:general secretion pathway protein L